MYSMNLIKSELTILPSLLLLFSESIFASGAKTNVAEEGAILTSWSEVCRLTQLPQSFVLMLIFQAHADFFSSSNGNFAWRIFSVTTLRAFNVAKCVYFVFLVGARIFSAFLAINAFSYTESCRTNVSIGIHVTAFSKSCIVSISIEPNFTEFIRLKTNTIQL